MGGARVAHRELCFLLTLRRRARELADVVERVDTLNGAAICWLADGPGCRCAHPGYDAAFWRAHVCHAQVARRVIVSQAAALAPSGKSVVLSRASRGRSRGAYRDRHERWPRDAMDAERQLTSDARRTAKSCGPDPPMPGSSFSRDVSREATAARKPGTPRRARISRKTVAQGVPAVPAALSLLACARCTFFCTQGPRVRPASGIPCAL